MFSMERRGRRWVLRAHGADIIQVGSKELARKILRRASAPEKVAGRAGQTRRQNDGRVGADGSPSERPCGFRVP